MAVPAIHKLAQAGTYVALILMVVFFLKLLGSQPRFCTFRNTNPQIDPQNTVYLFLGAAILEIDHLGNVSTKRCSVLPNYLKPRGFR